MNEYKKGGDGKLEHELTVKQQRFADEYIISGNATEAYKLAYPNVKKDNTAHASSSRMLRNVKVSSYIKERTDALEGDKIADMTEVRQLWTDIMRDREERASDRLKASEMMARTKGAFIDKQESTVNGELGIKVLWADDNDRD